jgi:Rhs element Vgr protein
MNPLLPTASTDLVTFKVKIDGNDIGGLFDILQLTVIKDVNRIPAATVVIADGDPAAQDFAASSSDHFIPGKEIEIRAGYHSDEETVFKGIIISQAIEMQRNRPSVLKIECRDKVFRMAQTRKNRCFPESTDSDIISTLLGEYGLDNQVEPTTVTHEGALQFQATDWDTINLRAEANGLIISADDGSVKVSKPDTGGLPTVRLAYGSNILAVEAEMDARTQLGSVKARAWSSQDLEVREAEAAEPPPSGPGNLTGADLGAVAADGGTTLVHPGDKVDAEIKAWADSHLLRSRMARVQGVVTATGSASLKPGMTIALEGLGDRFNGNAFVSGVRHEIDRGNWITHVRIGLSPVPYARRFGADLSLPPSSGLAAAIHDLQTGIVRDLEDPMGMERVKILLPLIHRDGEETWARMATLDAGDHRGTFFRPEVGDEVIVGFIHGDPSYPVILGMLHGPGKPAPGTASNDNHQKGLVTRSGMKIWFDDDKITAQLSTPGGYTMEMNEDKGELTLTDKHGNKFRMNSEGIALESVKDIVIKASGDLKAEGVNAGIKASVSMKAEGSAGAELSSGGSTVVKGSMVHIN